jgi:ribosomal protein L37E
MLVSETLSMNETGDLFKEYARIHEIGLYSYGNKISTRKDNMMNCEYCGSQIFENDRTCTRCGAPFYRNVSEKKHNIYITSNVRGNVNNPLSYTYTHQMFWQYDEVSPILDKETLNENILS